MPTILLALKPRNRCITQEAGESSGMAKKEDIFSERTVKFVSNQSHRC